MAQSTEQPVQTIIFKQIHDISGANLVSNTLGMKPAGNVICYPHEESTNTPMPLLQVRNLIFPHSFCILARAEGSFFIVDPTEKLMAGRGGRTVKILDVEYGCGKLRDPESLNAVSDSAFQKNKTGVITLEIELDVLFWKWISAKQIALVTKDAVYHWIVEGNSSPVKIFDRDSSLAGYQIFDYRMDYEQKWLLLIGHRDEGNRVVGRMQLHSVENKPCERVIDGHVGTFAQLTVEGDPNSTTCLCYTVTTEQEEELRVTEVGIPPETTRPVPFQKKFPLPLLEKADFPIGIEFSRSGFIYVMTKFAYARAYDFESGTCVFSYQHAEKNHKTLNILFTIAHKNGILAVSREGSVFCLCVDENVAIEYVKTTLGSPAIAMKIAVRNNWTGAGEF